jgi:hypothetical protein
MFSWVVELNTAMSRIHTAIQAYSQSDTNDKTTTLMNVFDAEVEKQLIRFVFSFHCCYSNTSLLSSWSDTLTQLVNNNTKPGENEQRSDTHTRRFVLCFTSVFYSNIADSYARGNCANVYDMIVLLCDKRNLDKLQTFVCRHRRMQQQQQKVNLCHV